MPKNPTMGKGTGPVSTGGDGGVKHGRCGPNEPTPQPIKKPERFGK